MRKRLWSPYEDEKLARCISKYRNGSWSDIARKAGLQRCGKSCRRRWMNYLRPDLKREKFTHAEIRLVMELHEVFGSRWSKIAAHLVGRTDNDVKNLWNTQMKKQLKRYKQTDHMDRVILADTSCSSADYQDTVPLLSYTSSVDTITTLKPPTSPITATTPRNNTGFTCPFNSQMFLPTELPTQLPTKPILNQTGLGHPTINLGKLGIKYHSSIESISKSPCGVEFSACDQPPRIPINKNLWSSNLFNLDHDQNMGSGHIRAIRYENHIDQVAAPTSRRRNEYEDWVLSLLHNNHDSSNYIYEPVIDKDSKCDSDHWWSSLEEIDLAATQFPPDCWWTLEMLGVEL